MRMSDVPDEAMTAPATQIPTRTLYDWDAVEKLVLEHGWIVLESPVTRANPGNGSEEAPIVKAFTAAMYHKGYRTHTRRLGKTRWYCSISKSAGK